MSHPALLNKTDFAIATLLLADEEGVAQFVPCVQATFDIGVAGEPVLTEQQPPVLLAGRWRADPAKTSLIQEPQMAFVKPTTDVVLVGHAYATTGGRTEGLVGIRLGPVQKAARVFGDRRFVSRFGIWRVSSPSPFEKMPITYERAFGGWDRRAADAIRHRCEVRNPVGVGFQISAPDEEGSPLPNFEDPQHLIQTWSDRPPPAGFGFVSPDWQPRLGFAGTYDATWQTQRRPLLPADFDRRFFNAASPGLVTSQHLQGNESGLVIGATAQGRLEFRLPGVPAPVCLVELRGRKRVRVITALDTVVVDADARTLTLTWRGHLAVRNGPHDIRSIEVHPNESSASSASVSVSLIH